MSSCPIFFLLFSLGTASVLAEEPAPCARVRDLPAAIECVKENEPAYRSASRGETEAKELESSAYRLINPDLDLEYLDGNNLGSVDREATAALLFTLELGGKRSARGKVLGAEGLRLKADAFDQRIRSLTEIGGALLRLNQLQAEKAVLQESLEAFKKVIRLYRSRGSLPPEQKVSLHAFELVLLGYERKLVETDASLNVYRKRVERLFGPQTDGVPLHLAQWNYDAQTAQKTLESWIEETPEMLRLRAEGLQAEGESDLARSQVWPDLQIGPAISRMTQGPSEYWRYGFRATFPLPLLSWNGAERKSRRATEDRVRSDLSWTREDVRTRYRTQIQEITRIRKLLEETPSAESLHQKHMATESLYQRGMITGALMIEAHRALVEHTEAKHELQSEYLKSWLTLKQLERTL